VGTADELSERGSALLDESVRERLLRTAVAAGSALKSERAFDVFEGPFIYSRRRPTFPRSCPRSIIGDAELNCRVRNGNGCDLCSMTTGNFISDCGLEYGYGWLHELELCRQHEIKAFMVKSNDRLVLVS
jgi:hypothetical protein